MDPITTAILAALTDKTISPTSSSNQNFSAAYKRLKTALRDKYGSDSDLIDAVEKLEANPSSFGRQELLKEEIAAAQATQDPELLAVAQHLLDQINAKSESSHPARLSLPPLQRPARVKHFVGREAELDQLLTEVRPGKVVALCGPAGMGKSALVAEAVWRLTPNDSPPEQFPDGIICHNFYDQPRADIALEQIARVFGEEPTPTAYEAAERALTNRQALLLLLGAEQADDLPGVLAMQGGCGVLITSDQADQEMITTGLSLDPLPSDQAVTLLEVWAGTQATDKAVSRQICDLVGGSSLAIRLIGSYLAARREKSTSYLSWLKQTRLPDLDSSQRQHDSVPLVLRHTLSQVSETAQQALAVIGLLALVPFDAQIVAETLAIDANQGLLTTIRKIFKEKAEEKKPDVGQAMAELVNYGLLRQIGQRYQIGHVLIHNYAQEHLAAPPKAIRRLAASYAALAWEQSALGPEGYVRLDISRPHIMKILNECLQWEDWEAAYSLAAAVEDYLDRQGYWSERVIVNEIGLITAWQLDRPNEGAWLSNLGDTFRTMGHARWAIEHFEKALATARQNGDKHSQGNSLGNLGLAHRDLGQIDLARQYLEQALTIFEEIGSPSARYVREWLAELKEA